MCVCVDCTQSMQHGSCVCVCVCVWSVHIEYAARLVCVCVCVCVCNFCTVLFYQTIYFLHRVNHHGVNHHGNDVLPSSLMATAGHGSWHCCTSAPGKIKASPQCLYHAPEHTLR